MYIGKKKYLQQKYSVRTKGNTLLSWKYIQEWKSWHEKVESGKSSNQIQEKIMPFFLLFDEWA